MGSSPRLSYAQLFSFQVSYSNHADSRGYANQGAFGLIGLAAGLGKKKGEWKRAILEFDYVMETMFLQDKDRIVLSATFKTYRRTVSGSSGDDDDDTLLSVRFEEEQWEVMAQNVEEKKAILHLLDCVAKNLSAEEASKLGKKNGVIGVYIMQSGVLVRKAKTAYKKDERFVIIVPGKLLLFLTPDLAGKHVRYATSLIGARVQISRSRMEFEVLVPNTKDLVFSSASSMEGFSSWVKAIEASANGDTRVYSDDSDGHDDGRRYGNSSGAGWGRPHRSHRGRGESSRPRARDYYDDEMSEDPRRGPATGGVQRSLYAGDDHRRQPPEDDRNWDREQGQYPGRPRSRPDEASYGRPPELHDSNFDELSRRAPHDEPPSRGLQPYQEGAETQEYQRSKMQDMHANRLPPQRTYNTAEPYGAFDNANDKGSPAFPKLQVRMSRVGNNDTGLKEEDKWGQKQFKNVNMRRRSVPLQCLDSALDEMTTSIGNMAPFQGQLQGIPSSSYNNNTDETATIYNLQSSHPNTSEVPSDHTTQSSVGFNDISPLAGAAPLVEGQQDYNDQSSYLVVGPKQTQSQGNDLSSSYINQSSYSTGPKQMQSQQGSDSSASYVNQSSYSTSPKQMQSQQGSDSSASYINQSSYATGPKQMQSQQGIDSSASFINQSSYSTGPKQMQSQQGNDSSSSYINQSSYSTGPKQMHLQQGSDSSSSYINQSSYSTGPKQMLTQGNNSSSSVAASASGYDPSMNTPDYVTEPRYNTNVATDSNKSDAGGYNPALSHVQQSAALGKSTLAAGAVNWGGGRLIPQIDAHKKPPMTRSDTKAYGAIMGGASSALPQVGANTRMPLGGSAKPQPPALKDPGARPFQG